MKNRSAAVRRMKVCTVMLFFISLLVLATSAQAAIVFYDDFEDGDHDGWLVSTTGGSGSTSVVDHNNSLMAYIHHTGAYTNSLSHDFNYASSDILSFDMHAITIYGGDGTHAWAGVTVSFLDAFNGTLGYARLLNTTNSGSLGSYDIEIDNVQHSYMNTWGDYASVAGLDESDDIKTVSLRFWAQGQSNPGNNSFASVWFDNVKVEAVPLPPAVLLLGSGMMGLLGVMRRIR